MQASSVDRGWMDRLKRHLSSEQHPVLLDVLQSFEGLDRLAARVGAIGPGESLAKSVRWWPVISLLGTYSSGKSTFVNDLLGIPVQKDGIQAVNDKFSVLCYGGGGSVQTLPGLALAADPRFPFYNIDEKLSRAVGGGGASTDISTYIDLKACPAARLRGVILIDSPGYDADMQREGILTLAEQIVDVSDLVLFLFDVHKTERKVIPRTLEMVSQILHRSDASKVVYVLNRIDEVPDDDLLDVYSRWKACLATAGLQAGDTYIICSPDKSKANKERLAEHPEWERDREEIYDRIGRVNRDRTYRAISVLREEARHLGHSLSKALPAVLKIRSALLLSLGILGFLAFGGWSLVARSNLELELPWVLGGGVMVALMVMALGYPLLRRVLRLWQRPTLATQNDRAKRLFQHLSSLPLFSLFRLQAQSNGWLWELQEIEQQAVELTLRSNDAFIDPSGRETFVESSPGTAEGAGGIEAVESQGGPGGDVVRVVPAGTSIQSSPAAEIA